MLIKKLIGVEETLAESEKIDDDANSFLRNLKSDTVEIFNEAEIFKLKIPDRDFEILKKGLLETYGPEVTEYILDYGRPPK